MNEKKKKLRIKYQIIRDNIFQDIGDVASINLAKFKIGKWHSVSQKTLLNNRKKKISLIDKKKFYLNLSKFGYSIQDSKKVKKNKFLNFIIIAFQRRFRQELINGKIDKECLLISQNLAKKLN